MHQVENAFGRNNKLISSIIIFYIYGDQGAFMVHCIAMIKKFYSVASNTCYIINQLKILTTITKQ